MKAEKLQGRQKAFAQKIAEGHTATEAYLLAGYRAAKRETAHRAASRLYTHPNIRAYIQELRRAGDDLAREETTLTIAKKLAFLARLVLTSSATLLEDDPLIQSHRILKDGTTSIRMPCKLKALKMHSELAGHFIPKPIAQSNPADFVQQLLDQIRQSLGHPSRESQNSAPIKAPPVSPPEVPTEKPPAAKNDSPRPLLNIPATQNSKPQPTTTKHRDLTSPPHPPSKTPADLRRLVQAQIRQSSPLYNPTVSPPHSPDPRKPPTTLRL